MWWFVSRASCSTDHAGHRNTNADGVQDTDAKPARPRRNAAYPRVERDSMQGPANGSSRDREGNRGKLETTTAVVESSGWRCDWRRDLRGKRRGSRARCDRVRGSRRLGAARNDRGGRGTGIRENGSSSTVQERNRNADHVVRPCVHSLTISLRNRNHPVHSTRRCTCTYKSESPCVDESAGLLAPPLGNRLQYQNKRRWVCWYGWLHRRLRSSLNPRRMSWIPCKGTLYLGIDLL